jgi:hypothetical protein
MCSVQFFVAQSWAKCITNMPGFNLRQAQEAKFVFENGCEQLILGSGQMGNVHLSPEAEAYFAKKGCAVLLQPTPQGDSYVQPLACEEDRPFHVTC